jgi:hypothetical protein
LAQVKGIWFHQHSNREFNPEIIPHWHEKRYKAMKDDPIVEEVRQYREQHAAQFDYDLQAIYQDLKNQESKSKKVFITYPAKLLEIASHAERIHKE